MKLKDFAENLYFHESLHFFAGFLVAASIFFLYGSVYLSIIGLIFSIFIDIDHYFEALFYFKFNLVKIIKNKYNCWLQTKTMTILFHSWELIFLMYFLGWKFNFMPLAATVGYAVTFHLVIDTLVYSFYYNMPFYQYFLIYRAINKFDFVKLYNEGKPRRMTYWEIYKKYGKR